MNSTDDTNDTGNRPELPAEGEASAPPAPCARVLRVDLPRGVFGAMFAGVLLLPSRGPDNDGEGEEEEDGAPVTSSGRVASGPFRALLRATGDAFAASARTDVDHCAGLYALTDLWRALPELPADDLLPELRAADAVMHCTALARACVRVAAARTDTAAEMEVTDAMLPERCETAARWSALGARWARLAAVVASAPSGAPVGGAEEEVTGGR